LTIKSQLSEVWMVQGDARVYLAPPDTRSVSPTNAKAYWLSKQLIQWTQVDGSGSFKLHHSATAQITAAKEGKVAGADGSITLDAFTSSSSALASCWRSRMPTRPSSASCTRSDSATGRFTPAARSAVVFVLR
jgi:pullulanase